jgi:hypothetical protein
MGRRRDRPESDHAALAVEPFGPWLRPGEKPEPQPAGDDRAAPVLDDEGHEVDRSPAPIETGTWLDEFLPIYRALAPTYAPDQIDRMDIAAVAVLLGIGTDPMRAEMAELAELARRRAAGEDVNWDDVIT